MKVKKIQINLKKIKKTLPTAKAVSLPKIKPLLSKIKLKFIKEKPKIFCLDIGATSIKIIRIEEEQEGKIRICEWGIKDFPALENKPDASYIAETIQNLIKEKEIDVKDIMTCIYGPSIKIDFQKTPYMEDKELGKVARWQASKSSLLNVEDAVVDYAVLGELTEAGQKKMVVIIATVSKNIVYKTIDILRQINLNPVNIELASLALFTLLKNTQQVKPLESIVFVELGGEITSINIVYKGILMLTRELTSVGGRDITKLIQNRLEISFEEAERLKKECNLLVDEAQQQPERIEQVREVIEEVLEKLAAEIERSLGYFLQGHPDISINRLILSGGGANIEGIMGFFKKRLEMEVEKIGGLERIITDEDMKNAETIEKQFPRLAVVLGLALRGLVR